MLDASQVVDVAKLIIQGGGWSDRDRSKIATALIERGRVLAKANRISWTKWFDLEQKLLVVRNGSVSHRYGPLTGAERLETKIRMTRGDHWHISPDAAVRIARH